MAEDSHKMPVVAAMRRDIPIVDERSHIEVILRLMQDANAPAATVVDRSHRVVGLMNYETIGELLMLRNADAHFRPGSRGLHLR
ncbi:hypothetical protein [Ensifer sp. SSB1]|jgi:predicted transcriptional regulator|uniref:hypothetical protein n=1 Tax=Ensifer sp. SSB1 TaxID=2795385 RepID=UPI001A448DBE|nr:hypothetical protein [Ensifer sp. SSB1]MBK5571868.1 hypothetical protein [Ensifer sp. SSB1]